MDFDASMVGENNDRAIRPLNRLVFFFLTKTLRFILWVLGSLTTCLVEKTVTHLSRNSS